MLYYFSVIDQILDQFFFIDGTRSKGLHSTAVTSLNLAKFPIWKMILISQRYTSMFFRDTVAPYSYITFSSTWLAVIINFILYFLIYLILFYSILFYLILSYLLQITTPWFVTIFAEGVPKTQRFYWLPALLRYFSYTYLGCMRNRQWPVISLPVPR